VNVAGDKVSWSRNDERTGLIVNAEEFVVRAERALARRRQKPPPRPKPPPRHPVSHHNKHPGSWLPEVAVPPSLSAMFAEEDACDDSGWLVRKVPPEELLPEETHLSFPRDER
jgi:hypothetical protein